MGLGTPFLGKDGNFIVLPFWLFLGAAQWIYIAPLAMLLKRLGRTGIAKGLWISGLLVVPLNGVYWAGRGVFTILHGIESRAVRKFAREHPVTHREVSGTVVALDEKRIEVRTAEGLVSIGLGAATHYVQSNGPFGNTQMDPTNVRVGGTVVVDASSFNGGPLYADYVSMSLPEPAESPSPH